MEAIRYYVRGAFQGVKQTPQAIEQQEEIIADLLAKVVDLVGEGKSEEEALGMAIASAGDLSPLVAEFEIAEEGAAPIPTVEVYAGALRLHAAVLVVLIGAALMILSTAFGAAVHMLDSSAALILIASVAAATLWLRSAYSAYTADPDTTEFRALTPRPSLLRTLSIWAGVCFAGLLMQFVLSDGFWVWPFWVATTAWALLPMVEISLIKRGVMGVASEPQAANASVNAA